MADIKSAKAAHGKATGTVNPADGEKKAPEEKKDLQSAVNEELQTVRIKRMIRASYGAYDKGEVVRIGSKIASALLKDGRAEKA